MDVGRVGLERLGVVQLLQEAHPAPLADAHVDRYPRPDLACGLERLEDHVGRARGPGHIERHQLVFRREVLLAQARDIVGVLVARRVSPLAGRGLRTAVGEHRAHARVGKPLDGRVGVLGRVVDVRPVEHAGDARVDRAEGAEEVARIGILRRVDGAERLLHHVDVVAERSVGQNVAQDALPHVAVGIDEARHHDGVRGVDHLGIGGADVRPHRRDLAAFHQHVGLLEVADRLVAREHAAALDEDRTAGCRYRAGGGGRLGERGAAHAGRHGGSCGNRAGRAGAQELTPRQRRSAGAATACGGHIQMLLDVHGRLPGIGCCRSCRRFEVPTH